MADLSMFAALFYWLYITANYTHTMSQESNLGNIVSQETFDDLWNNMIGMTEGG